MSAAPGTTVVPTRDRIVEAALRLFSERGTTAVSMRELADAAGVTVPGLYYHFTSKAELIREVYRAQGFGKELGEIELPPPAPVETIIVVEARREFTRFITQREFLSLMQGEAVLGDEDALEVGLTLGALWRARWAAALGRDRRRAERRPRRRGGRLHRHVPLGLVRRVPPARHQN